MMLKFLLLFGLLLVAGLLTVMIAARFVPVRKRRYSDRDHHLYPFTLALGCHSSWGVILDSGAHEDSRGDCHVRSYLGTVTLICELPRIISDHVKRHSAAGSWDPATVARLGRDWYEIHTAREFGFSISEGALHLHYGPQTFDSDTTKSRCIFLPWRNWRFIRSSHYGLDGSHFHTEFEHTRNDWMAHTAVEAACPKQQFLIHDFDGESIVATTHIEEREWKFGTGAFKWLSLFRRPKIRRELSISFDKECGPEKGSWKGGTMGTGIEILPGELHEAGFRRYCSQLHRSKYRRYAVKFVGVVEKPAPVRDEDCAQAAP